MADTVAELNSKGCRILVVNQGPKTKLFTKLQNKYFFLQGNAFFGALLTNGKCKTAS